MGLKRGMWERDASDIQGCILARVSAKSRVW